MYYITCLLSRLFKWCQIKKKKMGAYFLCQIFHIALQFVNWRLTCIISCNCCEILCVLISCFLCHLHLIFFTLVKEVLPRQYFDVVFKLGFFSFLRADNIFTWKLFTICFTWSLCEIENSCHCKVTLQIAQNVFDNNTLSFFRF